ncbi:MAG: hypothetical protein HY736_04895 [Verrucomicrobia bacterium]|nr:hypothetical protein [Verrucomicrobiota bacterium]
MLIFAVTKSATIADRLRLIPIDFWLKLGLGVLAIIVAIVLLRKLAHMNKLVLTVVTGLVISFLGFSWIYERNEPNWASPVVNVLSGFFPSKGKLEQKKSGL